MERGGRDMVLAGECLGDRWRIASWRIGAFRIKEMLAGSQMGARILMARQAVFHVETAGLPGEGHSPDGAVAGGASHTLVHVDRVIEVDMMGNSRDPVPGYRNAAPIALSHGFQERA